MYPIKILRIISRMNVGGPAVQIDSLMKDLNPAIFHQRLVTGFCEDNEVEFLKNKSHDFEVTRIRGFGRSINIIHDFKAFLTLMRIIRQFKPDIIHTHTAKAGLTGRLAGLLARPKAKRVHTFHGHLLTGYFKGFKLNMVISLEKLLSKITTRLIAVGEKVKIDLITAGIGNVHKFTVINPGITLDDVISDRFFNLKGDLPKNTVIVAYIGRLTKIKRIDRLIEVIKQVRSKSDRVFFLIAGGGEEYDLLISEITLNNLPVKLLGWVEDISGLLQITDIVLLTSDNEGTPISIIQAGLSGVPSISTNVGSVSELIDHDVSGFLCDKDPVELSEKIIQLSTDNRLSVDFGKNALKIMNSKFNKDKFLKDHSNLYLSVI